MSAPIWKPRATKLQTYEALYVLNRCFEATLLSFERLAQLRFFRFAILTDVNWSPAHISNRDQAPLFLAIVEWILCDTHAPEQRCLFFRPVP